MKHRCVTRLKDNALIGLCLKRIKNGYHAKREAVVCPDPVMLGYRMTTLLLKTNFLSASKMRKK